MYEDILGRPASAPEEKFMNTGQRPTLTLGTLVKVDHLRLEGKIDSIVLFAAPPGPPLMRPSLQWGYRVEGGPSEYLPTQALKTIAPTE